MPEDYPDEWYLQHLDGTITGPIPWEQVVLLAKEGNVAPGCLVYKQHESKVCAVEVPELMEAMRVDRCLEWYLEDNGSCLGPLTWRIVLRSAERGTLKPGCLVFRKGEMKVRASDRELLREALFIGLRKSLEGTNEAANGWFFQTQSGDKFGPLGFDRLCQLAEGGLIGPRDLVWLTGFGWEMAKECSSLRRYYIDVHKEQSNEKRKQWAIGIMFVCFLFVVTALPIQLEIWWGFCAGTVGGLLGLYLFGFVISNLPSDK